MIRIDVRKLRNSGSDSSGLLKSNWDLQNLIEKDTTPQLELQTPFQMLTCPELMDRILLALRHKKPLSVVSVGATEAFVMAQYGVYSEEEFMNHREAYNANLGHKAGFMHRGIRFPNQEARDAAVDAVRKADIVGYNTMIPDATRLAEKVFKTYELSPAYVFEANIRRVFMFSQPEKYEEMLRNRRIALVGSLAPQAKEVLEAKYRDKLGLQVAAAIPIYEYEEIPVVKRTLENYSFDLCFLGAGVNALILAPYIAEQFKAVVFDIGWSMQSMITGEIVLDAWVEVDIGLDVLMKL